MTKNETVRSALSLAVRANLPVLQASPERKSLPGSSPDSHPTAPVTPATPARPPNTPPCSEAQRPERPETTRRKELT